jgi:hypothetical protein
MLIFQKIIFYQMVGMWYFQMCQLQVINGILSLVIKWTLQHYIQCKMKLSC